MLIPRRGWFYALLAALCLLAACGRGQWRLEPEAVRFFRGGLSVHLPQGHPARAVRLLNATGALLLEQPVPTGAAVVARLDYPWAPGEALVLRLATAGPAAPALPLRAPGALPPPVSVTAQLPEGVALPPAPGPLLLPAQGTAGVVLTVRNEGEMPWHGTLEMRASGAALLHEERGAGPASWLRLPLSLPLPGQAHSAHLVLIAGPADEQGAVSWTIQGEGLPVPLQGEWRILAAAPEHLAAGLRLAESRLPADPLGAPLPHLPAEALVLPPPLPGWLGGAARDPYVPVSHARLVLENRLPGGVAAVVRTWVEPEGGGAPLDAFGSPLLRSGGAVLVAQARVPPGAQAVLAQPLYLDPARVAPGAYRRCVQVLPWGVTTGAPPDCRPLRVTASPLWDWAVLWLATLAAVAGFVIALWRLPHWLGRFASRDQVLVALTFGLAFLASTVPFLAVSALGAALLGPFLFLVEGVFYKGVLFVVLGGLFAVLPRPGVYLLFYALWMAAQALFSGWYAHGPVTLLFAGVAVTCMEAALWLGGITRRGGSPRAILRPALAIGLGEAAIVYWDLLLLRALYRQYYASWYLLLEAGSAGLYAALGAAAGLRMGRLLREMRRPAPAPLPNAASRPAPEPLPGAPLLEVAGLTYAYPGAGRPVLRDVSLAVQPGEVILLGGATGGGKTTLLRLIQGLLPPPRQGEIKRFGRPRHAWDPRAWALHCALLFQEPGTQIVQPTVAEEVALGLRLAGRSADRHELQTALAAHGLAALERRPVHHLSGGEMQRTVLAALLAGSPRLLLLDEPLAHLDAAARTALAERLGSLAAAGMAVLAVEHRLDWLLPIAHRVLWLEGGAIAFAGSPAAFRAWRAGRRFAAFAPVAGDAPRPQSGSAGLCLRDVTFRHAGAAAPVLQGVTATLAPGAAVALTGANGAGKSTLLQLILGLRAPQSGAVTLDGAPVRRLGWRRRSRQLGYVPQPGDLLLHAPTTLEELAAALRWRGWARAAAEREARAWLERLGLAHAAGRFPHLLSRGERQRLALGAVLIAAPRVLVLDEPFAGQDAAHAALLLELCREFLAQDPARSLLVASHDLEALEGAFPARWHLEHGRLSIDRLAAPPDSARPLAAGGAR